MVAFQARHWLLMCWEESQENSAGCGLFYRVEEEGGCLEMREQTQQWLRNALGGQSVVHKGYRDWAGQVW